MPNQVVNEVKDRLNIVEVISSYIQLKKAGTNYKATCPFHQEKSASLMVSPSKQIWHCFGCNEGGNVFNFVMKYENIDFGEALKILAQRAGVQLPKYNQENKQQQDYKDKLLKINSLTAQYYHEVFKKSSVAEHARKYLQQRGLKSSTIEEWQIGFAPDGYHALSDFLQKKVFTRSDLIKAGVASVSTRSNNEIYDRFVNRITFPIKNYSGNVVGFTARTLDNNAKAAKYVNSPETDIYHKSKIIFGLYQAKQEIRKKDFTLIVEGNMDVIACHQAGFKNAVGSSGTAFTFEQLEMLARLSKNLKFAFDTDKAGIIATRRALEMALQLGFTVSIVKIENAKDPDEMIKKNLAAFQKALDDAPLYMEYFIEKAFENYDPKSVAQKKEIAASIIPLIKKLADPLEAAHYAKMLAQKLQIPEKTVYEILAKTKLEPGTVTKKRPIELLKNRTYLLEEKVIGYVLLNEEHRDIVLEKVLTSDFRNAPLAKIFQKIISNPSIKLDELTRQLGEDQELAKMAAFVVESEYSQKTDEQHFDREFKQILKEFKQNSAKIAITSLVNQMVLADQKKDKQTISELNQKFLELSKVLKDNEI